MIIHDHFGGSFHCVECHGPCKLAHGDLHLTQLVRNLMEYFAYQGEWLPTSIEEPLAALYGERWNEFRRRAFDSLVTYRRSLRK